jgi:hypothetical protein
MTDAGIKVGTKAFGIRMVRLFRACRTRKRRGLSDGGFFVPERPSAPIITQRVDYVLVRNSLQSLGLVLEDTDETVFWLEMLAHCNIVAGTALRTLIRAANELTCIFVPSLTTAKKACEFTEP